MKPTDRQIEAAAKAIYEMVGYDMRLEPGCHDLPLRAAQAALAAAAEAQNLCSCGRKWADPEPAEFMCPVCIYDNATIERLRAALEEIAANCETEPVSSMDRANAAIARKALKDKP